MLPPSTVAARGGRGEGRGQHSGGALGRCGSGHARMKGGVGRAGGAAARGGGAAASPSAPAPGQRPRAGSAGLRRRDGARALCRSRRPTWGNFGKAKRDVPYRRRRARGAAGYAPPWLYTSVLEGGAGARAKRGARARAAAPRRAGRPQLSGAAAAAVGQGGASRPRGGQCADGAGGFGAGAAAQGGRARGRVLYKGETDAHRDGGIDWSSGGAGVAGGRRAQGVGGRAARGTAAPPRARAARRAPARSGRKGGAWRVHRPTIWVCALRGAGACSGVAAVWCGVVWCVVRVQRRGAHKQT
jgi:hypothetical protein